MPHKPFAVEQEVDEDDAQSGQGLGGVAAQEGAEAEQAQEENRAVEQQTPTGAEELAQHALPQDAAEGFVGQIAGVERIAVAGQVEDEEGQAGQEDGGEEGGQGGAVGA